MNLTPHEQEQLRLVLAQIADCKQTALDAIDGSLKGLGAAEEILGEILAAQAEPAGPSGDSADLRAQEAVSVVSDIGSFLDFAIAVISAWQGNSWAVIHPDPLEYGLFRLQRQATAEGAGPLFQPDQRVVAAATPIACLVF